MPPDGNPKGHVLGDTPSCTSSEDPLSGAHGRDNSQGPAEPGGAACGAEACTALGSAMGGRRHQTALLLGGCRGGRGLGIWDVSRCSTQDDSKAPGTPSRQARGCGAQTVLPHPFPEAKHEVTAQGVGQAREQEPAASLWSTWFGRDKLLFTSMTHPIFQTQKVAF